MNAPAIKLLDEAIGHVPNEALANAVRALPDADLAGAVRETPGLRRVVLMAMLEQLTGAADKTAPPKAKRAAQPRAQKKKRGLRRRERKALESEQKGGRREQVLALVKKAGEAGTTTSEVAAKIGVSGATVRGDLRQLCVGGDIRKEGSTSSARYFAA